jgi:DNA repair exonuclease SbcCD ATPase subunit
LSNLTLIQIESGLTNLRTKYNQEAGQLALLEQQQAEKQQQLQQAKDDIDVWQQVQTMFSEVSEYSRKQLKLRIEETVTAALQAIFCEDNIKFVIDIKVSNGKPAAEWTVVSSFGDFAVAASPEDAKGGGITDVVSLALRLALLELARPKPTGPVILDEPGKMISREYLPNVADFLKQYLQQTGRQGLMITHAEALAEVADVSYRVSQADGISEVTRI